MSDGNTMTPYNLPGPQVERTAGYWTFGPCQVPRVVRIADLLPVTDYPNPKDANSFPSYPTDPTEVQEEIDELKELALLRGDPYTEDMSSARKRLPLSKFLQFRPPPLGAVFNTKRDQPARTDVTKQCGVVTPEVVTTGRELARMFEAETPGLYYRHALNCLFDVDISPPRQARIWMALDITIYSALQAAWYYKWASDRTNVSYRRRPKEFDPSLDILYDKQVDNDGAGDMPATRKGPVPSPGTPRHPSYPSGHSTFSAAASEILSYFFPHEKDEFDRLADNIGLGRMWAGVHYRSDHVFGQKLGRTVAQFVICQLEGDPIPKFTRPPEIDLANLEPAPSKEDVRQEAYDLRKVCLCDPKGDEAIKPPTAESAEKSKSPQQGAR